MGASDTHRLTATLTGRRQGHRKDPEEGRCRGRAERPERGPLQWDGKRGAEAPRTPLGPAAVGRGGEGQRPAGRPGGPFHGTTRDGGPSCRVTDSLSRRRLSISGEHLGLKESNKSKEGKIIEELTRKERRENPYL